MVLCTAVHLQGLASIIQGVDLNKVSQGMTATLQAGIDPSQLIQRFQQSPSLAKAMENPRVLAALMDMARWAMHTLTVAPSYSCQLLLPCCCFVEQLHCMLSSCTVCGFR